MNRVGGITSPDDLGISQRIVDTSLQEAHLLRERVTLLYYNNVNNKKLHTSLCMYCLRTRIFLIRVLFVENPMTNGFIRGRPLSE
ncbi:hypothetical protein JCM9152_3803 [Halalkalibacter hemicellulosilyticusJCM 9152]|uniref:Uncharacterized protein n=1 Tax=Halalkalibacter hemicellulosilyticusJCM 9152 TaxID=1236971 RepID=W4QK27_9BACI|nr:hypothetical protein JCM9152_3803 [Halalkalibacter hemicellulosilyticusJCM 9152]